MDVAELTRRLGLLEHERPGVITIRHKDSGATLARCTPGTLINLMVTVINAPGEQQDHNHWLWCHLKNAAPLAEGGVVFDALRRLAQGLGGDSVHSTADAYLQQVERDLEKRRGSQ